jgi:phosphoribosylaminoimidazolecarboxamide formyltransferase/IMP cyclohydrolase
MKRALLSVSDKRGIVDFAKALDQRGWEIVSTGGTARTLRDAGLDVTSVSDVSGHPEIMDGRVKTLHPAIHAGLLARRAVRDDMSALQDHGYGPIDLVAVNLYPFRETVTDSSFPVQEAMEVVDIGGPTMLRAAAKNHADVWVVVDPDDYEGIVGALDAEGDDAVLRRWLAAKVFLHVSAYDAAIARYLHANAGDEDESSQPLPETLDFTYERIQVLRYGENPTQEAAFYGTGEQIGLNALTQHHGRELSYNNLLDLDGAILSLCPFAFSPRAAVSIIKHTTPCGLGLGETLIDAYAKALATDRTSAFGSVIVTNRPIDEETAALMAQLFIECIVAPGYDDGAMAALTKKKNIRLLSYPGADVGEGGGASEEEGSGGGGSVRFLERWGAEPAPRQLRSVYGGLLVQSSPMPPWYGRENDCEYNVVTARGPTEQEWDDLLFAWAAIFGVKSNAILIARDGGVLGIGAGQMSRVDSSKIAVRKAGEAGFDLSGSALASDAYFPFRDGVDAAAEAGVTAVIQPGGSIRDEEVIAAADEHGIAMVFTGSRLFRH